jgi:hypothetical protein
MSVVRFSEVMNSLGAPEIAHYECDVTIAREADIFLKVSLRCWASSGRSRRGAADGTWTRDRIKMSDRPSHNLSGLDIELARRIEQVCRQFEADWREGRRPRIEDYPSTQNRQGRLSRS